MRMKRRYDSLFVSTNNPITPERNNTAETQTNKEDTNVTLQGVHKRLMVMCTYEDIFEERVVVENDGDHAQITKGALRATQNILSLQPQLSWRIQPSVVHPIVVPLGQYFNLWTAIRSNELTQSRKREIRPTSMLQNSCSHEKMY